ncbi:MAG: hypothetical protein Q8K60_06335, partial [Parachlamydiaceae bacterium]|nr:hypothetical protein [Parachlamydiaceae bacterium]
NQIRLSKHKNSSKIAHQWMLKIDDELFKQLSQCYSLNTIKALCSIFDNKIQSPFFKSLNKNELNVFLNICINFNKIQKEIENSDFDLIYQTISLICQKIRFQNDIETHFFIKLIECLENQSSPLKWLQVIKFFPSILKKGDTQFTHLTTIYSEGIRFLFNNFKNEFIDEVIFQAEYFNSLCLKLKLSSEVKANISYFFFKFSMIEKNIKNNQCNEQSILKEIQAFKAFFPKFFKVDRSLRDSLEWIGATLAQYSKHFSIRDRIVQTYNENHQINSAIFNILYIKSTLKIEGHCLKNYYQQALKIIFNQNIDPFLFIEALNFVGNEYLKFFNEKKIKFNEVIELVEEIIFFFPPNSWKIDDQISISILPIHLQNHKIYALDLLSKLKEYNHPSKFLALDFYFQPELLHNLQINKKNKNEKIELFKLMDRLLSYSPLDENSLMIAGIIIAKFIPSLELEELNKLRTYHLKFFELTKNLNLLKQTSEVANVINYNIKMTEKNLVSSFSKEKKIVYEYLKFLYSNSHSILVNLTTHFNGCQEQFDLMFTSIEMIESQLEKSQFDQKAVEEYLNELHLLMPIILEMINNLEINDSTSTNLVKTITSLMDALITHKIISQNLLNKINSSQPDLLKIQRESFFEFLDKFYLNWESSLPQKSNHLKFFIFIPYIKFIIEIKGNTKNFNFLKAHKAYLSGKFKQVIENNGVLFDKQIIKILDFYYEDALSDHQKNNLIFTSIVHSIFDIEDKDQLLTILKMIAVLFFENSVKNKIKKSVFDTLLKYYLKFLINYFNKYQDQTEKHINFLISFVTGAIKKKLFNSEQVESEQFFYWFSHYYQLFDRNDPVFDIYSLKLLTLKNSINEEDLEREILKLMPDLCHYILQTGSFFYSFNLVDLVFSNIKDENKKNTIILNWLRTFEKTPIKKEDQGFFENHMKEIVQKSQKNSSIPLHCETLTFKYFKKEEFPIKEYLSLETITIKKCLAEHFNLTNF